MSRPAHEELLLSCVRDRGDDGVPAGAEALLAEADQSRLLEDAVLHRVAGLVARALDGVAALEAQIAAELRAEQLRTVATQMRAAQDVRRVAAALHGAVPWLVVKGPVLASHYRRTDLRSYVDVDVLVPPRELPRALELLEAAGFSALDANWTLLAESMSGEVHLRTPYGGVVDLHWDLTNDSRTRRSFALRTDALFERSRTVVIGGATVRTLDAVDTLVHTAMHAARSGGDRLIWLKDLEQLVLSRDYGWDQVADRSAEHRARLPVAVMLQRSRATLGVPGLPDDVLQLIAGPTAWCLLGRVVDRASPVVRAGPDGSLARLYARALRGDGRQTVRELARRSVARARRQGRPDDLESPWDARNPRSRLHPSGGPQARAAFLEAVARC